MDLARLNFAVRSGLYKVLLKERLYGVVASTKINYLKSLLPMEKFTIQTKLVAVDDGWGYIHHDFINKKGKLAASALIKIAFLKKGRRVNFRDIISLVDKRALNLKLSDQHKMFFEAEKEFLEESIASYYSL
jgi:acyl-CoA thioesterase FadM